MRAPGRSIAAAMVPLGAIAGHALGYLVAGRDPALSGTHSHLRPIAWVAAAVAVTALACLALVGHERNGRGVRLSRLVAAQAVLFCLVEVAEHLHAGHGVLSSVQDPSFRWGVAAQLLSAAVMVAVARSARSSGARVRALLLRRRAVHRASSRARHWPERPRVAWLLPPGSAVSERGPPCGPAPV